MKNFLTFAILISLAFYAAFALEAAVMPFFIAAIIAYILHPAVDGASAKFGINRNFLIMLTVCLVIFGIICLCVIFVPMVYKQASIFLSKMPHYRDYIQENISPFISRKIKYLSPDFSIKIDDEIYNILTSISTNISSGVAGLTAYTSKLATIVITIVLVPVILFYLLKDWPQKLESKSDILPDEYLSIFNKFLRDVDKLLSAYMRGQFRVCIFMSLYYSIMLSILGMDLALLMGFISGFLIILPFIGFLVSFAISITIGYLDFGASAKLIYLIMIYASGSLIEGGALTPRIIGNKIGLHPLWIIFSVLACGHIFGIIGMLFAIPIAGITKIVIKTLAEVYKAKRARKRGQSAV